MPYTRKTEEERASNEWDWMPNKFFRPPAIYIRPWMPTDSTNNVYILLFHFFFIRSTIPLDRFLRCGSIPFVQAQCVYVCVFCVRIYLVYIVWKPSFTHANFFLWADEEENRLNKSKECSNNNTIPRTQSTNSIDTNWKEEENKENKK